MSSDASPLETELEVATRLARAAAAQILDVRARARASAREKPDAQGPVTEADLAADRLVYEGLRAAFPNDIVVTEERWRTGEHIALHPRVWFVDPLDGTEDFIAGTPDYAVMIGLVREGRAVLGVVAQPETGLVWRAINEGVPRCERLDAEGRKVSLDVRARVLPASGRPRAAVSRSHPSALVRFLADELGVSTVVKGSVGLKIASIVDGDADVYLSASERIKVWDTAAPQAILEAAGGSMSALAGAPLRYEGPAAHPGGVCAAIPVARALLAPQIPEALAAWRARGTR